MDLKSLHAAIEPNGAEVSGFIVKFRSGEIVLTELEVPTEEAGRMLLEELSASFGIDVVPPAVALGLYAKH